MSGLKTLSEPRVGAAGWLRNVFTGYADLAVGATVFVLLTPLLVEGLGVEGYALWVLSHTITFYLGFLDLGFGSAQVRFHARGGSDARSRALARLTSTVALSLTGAGVLAALAGVLIAALPAERWLELSASGAQADFRLVLLVLSVNLLVQFPAAAVENVLEGAQRFDLRNARSIAMRLIGATVQLALLRAGYGIVALAIAELALSVLQLLVDLALVARVLPGLLRAPATFCRRTWRRIRRFSLWASLDEALAEGAPQLDKLLVAAVLPMALLTPYAIAGALAAVLIALVHPLVETFFPLASQLQGERRNASLARLVTLGTKTACALAAPLAVFLAAFGDRLVRLWIPDAGELLPRGLLPVLLLDAFVTVFLWTSAMVLIGTGRVRALVVLALAEIALASIAILVLAPRHGLLGAAVGSLAANALVGFGAQIPLACRAVGITTLGLLSASLGRVALAATPSILLAVAISIHTSTSDSWLALGGIALLIAALHLAGMLTFGTSRSERAWPYRVEWLRLRDAAAVARLERRLRPARERLGRRKIVARLSGAEAAGDNLGLALFRGPRLIGYLLAFRDAACATIAAEGIAVEPVHRAGAAKLLARFAFVLRARAELRGLPIVVASPIGNAFWIRHERALARFGWRLAPGAATRFEPERAVRRAPHVPPPLRTRLRALRTSGSLCIGYLGSHDDWALLEPHWDRLLETARDPTVFQRYAYARTWWQHLGWNGELFIVVALRGDTPVAIAPLQITRSRWLGREQRCLGFIGQPSEVDRPTLLAHPLESEAPHAIAGYLVAQHHRWSCLVLQEQSPDDRFLHALSEALRRGGLLVTCRGGQDCLHVELRGSWEHYLGSRTRAFRKSVRRKIAALRAVGPIALVAGPHVDAREALEGLEALERYVEVERRSWKARVGLGAARSSAHLAFYRALVERFGAEGMAFRFLLLDGRVIAATFGLAWRRRYYSLQIAHDERAAEQSPGFVLTALELERAFERREHAVFDLLGGFPANKRGWANGTVRTVALYADAPSFHGHAFHLVYFRLKPRLRRVLETLGALDFVTKTLRRARRHAPAAEV